MFLCFSILLLATVLSTASNGSDPTSHSDVLRTIAAITALPEGRLKDKLPVELEGTVIASLRQNTTCIIDDGTGRYFFYLPRPVALPPGSRIHLKGLTGVDDFHVIRQDSISVSSYQITGFEELPPYEDVSVARVLSGSKNFHPVRMQGLVDNVFADEINPEWTYLVLSESGKRVYVTVQSTAEWIYNLTDAEVRLTGAVLPHYCAERMFIGPHLELWSTNCIHVITPPPIDIFDAPYLEDVYHVNPDEIQNMRRRRVEGTVLATWHGDRFLLREASDRIIQVTLAHGETVPPTDTSVKVVGHPETDLFHLGLSRAHWKISKDRPLDLPSPWAVDAKTILGNERIDMGFYGRLITIRGILRNLPAPGNADGRINLECGDYLIPIDMSAIPETASELLIGSELAVTGICLMTTENWNPANPFPILGGISVIVRRADDVVVLSRPPWWTPGRLFAVIGALLLALTLVIFWNHLLKRLVERRGHELLRAQISQAESQLRTDERTRLAAELHDYTAQNLAAVFYQVSAARAALDQNSPETSGLLKCAAQMLQSCRIELRRCLWDLKNDALDEASFEDAVRKTVTPVAGEATIAIRFNVRRTRLSDATAHAILSICRELVANAVRHGQAKKIRIAGEAVAEGINFLVRDDGVGFDVKSRPGPADGHFGLDGVQSRIGRVGGSLDIVSTPGEGTKVQVLILSKTHSEIL